MKYTSILLCILCTVTTFSIFGQENQSLLLSIEEQWRSENIEFPIAFAPSLDYKGIGEVRFSKGWPDANSDAFWTYAFLWYLDEDPRLTPTKLETDLQAYFDGLMALVGKGSGLDDIPKTNAVFIQKDAMTYHGKISVFDAFFIKDLIFLNVKVVYAYCAQKQKHTALFTVTPQAREHAIWQTLHAIDIAFECN